MFHDRLNNIKMPLHAKFDDVLDCAKEEIASDDIFNLRIVKKIS